MRCYWRHHSIIILSVRRCHVNFTIRSLIELVTFFFSDIFPSDQTMALGSTQPLVKMSARNIPGGKCGRCVRLTTYHHTVPLSRNLGALSSLDHSGPARPVTGVLYLLYLYGKCRSIPLTTGLSVTTILRRHQLKRQKSVCRRIRRKLYAERSTGFGNMTTNDKRIGPALNKHHF